MLHMRHTLELLLLACWQLGEAASPLDVSRWALDGRLPYLSFAADEGTQLAQFRTILGPDFITVKGQLPPRPLHLLLPRRVPAPAAGGLRLVTAWV